MKTMELSRRQFLKGTGALIVSFNLFPYGIRSLRASDARRRARSYPTRFLDRRTSGRHGDRLHQQSRTRHRYRNRTGADRGRRIGCFLGEKSKSIWAIPKRPSTKRRLPAAGPSSAPGRRYVRLPQQRARNSCVWRRKSSALPLRSSPLRTEWSAYSAIRPNGYPTRS